MDVVAMHWVAILVSAGVVWVVSAIMWMAMPHHKQDHIALPNESAFMDFVRAQNIPPGNYGFPDCGSKELRESAVLKEAWAHGPIGMLSLWKTPVNMGPKMVATFIYYLVVSTVIAYLGSFTIEPHANAMRVFRIIGTAGVLAYAFAFIPNMIWYGAYTRTLVACVVDGIIYGLVTGAVFAWLWK